MSVTRPEGWVDGRIKHGSKSRIKAGCTCDICEGAKDRVERETLQKKQAQKIKYDETAVGMTDVGWIVLQVQRMAEDKTIPASKRARARWWYNRLTMAESAPATPIVYESGGRRRSHNDRRVVASDMQWNGPYKRRLKDL